MTPAQIKETRLQAGFTQAQLAKALGVTVAYVSMLEGGKRVPSRLFCIALDAVCKK
jgi:transcriptional regulator with XRE-family HTH domain